MERIPIPTQTIILKMAPQNNIKLLQWNARSLRDKRFEIESLLNDFNIACFQETWLNDSDIFRLKNFNLIRKDRVSDTHGGGLITAVRNDLSHNQIQKVPEFNGLELLAVRVKSNNSTYNIFNIYRDHRINLENTTLKSLINFISRFKNVLICSDFNAHNPLWSSGRENKIGKWLASEMLNSNLVIINDPSQATLVPKLNNQPGSPDVTLVSIDLIYNTNWSLLEDGLGSDHLPVVISISEQTPEFFTNRTKLNTNKVNWDSFQQTLELELLKNKVTSQNPVEAYGKFTELIIEELKKAGAKISKGNRTSRVTKPIWWTTELDIAINDRKNATSKFRETRNSENSRKYSEANEYVKNLTKITKKEFTRKYLQSLNPSSSKKSIWDMIKGLKGFVNSPKSVETFDYESPMSTQTIDKLCTSTEKPPIPIPNKKNNHQLDNPISINEMLHAIEDLKSKSSPGKDMISNDIIKRLPYSAKETLRNIFNDLIKLQQFPKDWSNYITILIPKPENKGFRPIALASNILKLLERIIKNRLEWFVEKSYIIPQSQYGFRKQKSTQDSTTLLATRAYLSLSKKQVFAALMLDIEGAFDNVVPDILINDLIDLNISSNIISFIQNIIRSRNISFYVNKKHVADRTTYKGLPQGSALSPLLFNIYVRKIIANIGKCSNLQFADDCAITFSHKNPYEATEAIEEGANNLKIWLGNRGLNIAPHKSKLILFNNRRKLPPDCKITIENTEILPSNQVKFLGVIFDHKLKWVHHIKYIKNKAVNTLNLIKAFSNKKFGVTTKLLLNTYKTYKSHVRMGSLLLFKCCCLSSKTTRICSQLRNKNVFRSSKVHFKCGSPECYRRNDISSS